MTEEERQFLEEVQAGERIHQAKQEDARKEQKNLMLRNVLNSFFILLAVVAMFCIGLGKFQHKPLLLQYGLMIGIVAVLIKMVEATLRMAGMARKPKQPHRFSEE